MKNDELLQNALGLIDDQLILDAKAPGKHKAGWIRWVAAAACLTLMLGWVGYLITGTSPAPSVEIKIAENLWQQEGFSAYSLSYSSNAASLSTGTGGKVVLLSEQSAHIQTQSIIIDPNQTFKFERLIAQRYAVYLSDTGSPVFYDTVEDRKLDLQLRILGDTSHILERFQELAFETAQQKYPGFLETEENRRYLSLYLTYSANDTLTEKWDELTNFTPDLGFMDGNEEFWGMDHEQKLIHFWNLPWSIYCDTLSAWEQEAQLRNAPYGLSVLGIDETNGMCIVKGSTLTGDGAFYGYYDIPTDTLRDLPDSSERNIIGLMQNKGYSFRFFADGKIATVAWPECGFDGTSYLYARNYQGENLGVFFLDEHTAHSFQSGWSSQSAMAASHLYVSDNSSVLYYKKMDEALVGRDFRVSEDVWANRLTLFNRDTDHWVFHSMNEDGSVGRAVALQGKFIRFAANETAVIMEQGGSYYAYNLAAGSDITQAIIDETVSLYAHELLKIVLDDGMLYTVNLFTGQRNALGPADKYTPTDDGAFVFAYCQGDSFVTCYNAASGESCQIQIDATLCDQLFSTENVVLQMSHNDRENTFLISYYIQEDVAEEAPVDFYGMLEQLEPASIAEQPADPILRTDLTVTEDMMNQFRSGAYRYDHPNGIISWETYYPASVGFYQDRHTIFQCLGLSEPENYLDVKGTKFILYENGDERLELIFWEDWLLYDYQDWDSGFHIEYTVGGKTYDYQFLIEGSQ